MAILEALKELGKVIVESAKENPVAAACIGGATVATIGGGVYLRKRSKNKAAAAQAMTTLGYDPKNPAQPQAEQVAAVAEPVVASEAAPAPQQ
ncbi:hypothetical protein D3C78_888020 [compost metagenome]